MADISVATSHLLGLWLQLLGTGAYLLYFPRAVLVLRRKMRDGLSIWLPCIFGLLFVLTVTDMVIDVVRGYEAYATHPGERPDPEAYYAEAASPKSLAKNAIIVAQAVLSDAVIVYRTFVTWNCSPLMIATPVALFLSSSALGVWAMWTLSQTKIDEVLIVALAAVRFRYFFIVTFTLNVLCVALICGKIWRVKVTAPSVHGDSPLSGLLGVIIESAGFYCVYLFCLIVTGSIKTNVFFVFLDGSPPVVALVFSVLIVGAQRPSGFESESTLWSGILNSLGFGGKSNGQSQRSIPGVEIRLERIVHCDGGSTPAEGLEDSSAEVKRDRFAKIV